MQQISIKQLEAKYLQEAVAIWNKVVEDGEAFPQEDTLTLESGEAFFGAQTYTAVAVNEETDEVYGLYILHPNNVGRCGHIANASYAVRSDLRGLHIGEKLVTDCLKMGREKGFSILQFNAVVEANVHARHLYERLGFQEVGRIKAGFRMKDGHYEDIFVYYHTL